MLVIAERPELIIRPLLSIDKVNFNINNLKVLPIGPKQNMKYLFY
ncbi:MAG: hypothetical protein KatS3mg068_2584 [Candidatus Sericytochromatia bacterium]|nr:MAG: hypothetical protein KatS3mg068_2584 [Candidatus Sericytochromatia bacterium]